MVGFGGKGGCRAVKRVWRRHAGRCVGGSGGWDVVWGSVVARHVCRFNFLLLFKGNL